MTDRTLLLIALAAAGVNAAGSTLRTLWQWDKRRDWKRRQDG